MKASEALEKLQAVGIYGWRTAVRSKVDETKTVEQMLNAWMRLFEAYPDMKLGSIMKYNVNRDFQCL